MACRDGPVETYGQKNKTYWRYAEMKKLIASLLVLVFGATMVMAEVPAGIGSIQNEILVTASEIEPDFLAVEGIVLNESESGNVKGGMGAWDGYDKTEVTVKHTVKLGPYTYERTEKYVKKNSGNSNTSLSNTTNSTRGQRRRGGRLTY